MRPSSGWAAALAAAALATGVASASAQATAEETAACAGTRAMRDTLRLAVYAWAPARSPHEPAAEFVFRQRQAEIVARLVDPVVVTTIPGFLGTALADCGTADRYRLPDLDGELFFQVRDDGRLAALSFDPRSGSPEVNRALARAALRADSQRLLEPLPRGLRGTPIGLRLAVATEAPDSVAAWRIGRVVLAYVPVDEPPRLAPGWRRPSWPDVSLWAQAGDSVSVNFVVDARGDVVMSTLRLRSGTWLEFADQAVASVSTFRYTPPRSRGCPVPMRLRFTFVWGWRGDRD